MDNGDFSYATSTATHLQDNFQDILYYQPQSLQAEPFSAFAQEPPSMLSTGPSLVSDITLADPSLYFHVQEVQLEETPPSQADQDSEDSDTPQAPPCPFILENGTYRCAYPGCKSKKPYPQPGGLTKHQRNHTRPEKCNICDKGYAQNKDLYRHMWKEHRLDAIQQNIPRVDTKCPVEGCNHRGRSDNVTRHLRTVHSVRTEEEYLRG